MVGHWFQYPLFRVELVDAVPIGSTPRHFQETREQLDFLRLEGCDRLQGYYFSRPLPAPALLEFVKKSPQLS